MPGIVLTRSSGLLDVVTAPTGSDAPGRSKPAEAVGKFVIPEVIFGPGALGEIGHAAVRLGARRPMLVTDPGVWEASWSEQAARHLRDAGLATTVWTGITPNPKEREVQAGAEHYRESGCDVVVAVGGGSAIDAAKGIAVVVSNGGSILDYEGIDKVTQPMPPLIAAPTTAGTGADLSQFAIISDTARLIKVTLLGRALVPDISITDPRTLTTMPSWLAVTTGLDALTHGVESYVSRAATFLTDGHAVNAVRLVHKHLARSVERPGDPDAQWGMARASMSAGIAFTNAILGATHAISHQLGGALDLPHGMLNALLLPHVVRFNAEEFPDRFRPIAEALGADAARMPAGDVADTIVDFVTRFSTYFGIPQRLRDLNVREEDLPGYADTAMRDACMTTNPRVVTRPAVISLLRAAY